MQIMILSYQKKVFNCKHDQNTFENPWLQTNLPINIIFTKLFFKNLQQQQLKLISLQF